MNTLVTQRFSTKFSPLKLASTVLQSTQRSSQCRRASDYSVAGGATTEVTPQEISGARQYCLDLLRKSDTPSSLLLPYIPSHARDAYVALRALNVDVARTADTTSTPTIGAMRLQFHRDAIKSALAGSPPRQPIALLLAQAAQELAARTDGRSTFHRSWLMRLVDARERALSNPPYPDLAAVESYAEKTYSTLLYLTLQALPMSSLTADHVASHIGKAVGIAAVLRGLPLIAFPGTPGAGAAQRGPMGDLGGASRPGAVMLPVDIMVEAGVREEDVLRRGAEAHGLRDAVFAVATRASDHLITARQMLANVRAGKDAGHEFEHAAEEEHAQLPVKEAAGMTQAQELEQAFGVFMPAVATQLWLDRLQKCDFDVFNPKLRMTDWKLPFKAYWAYSRRTF